jgi:hypothetical protein
MTRGLLVVLALVGSTGTLSLTGCAAKAPSLYGPGRFHDITEIRRGMSQNEVVRVMGKNYKSIDVEGLQGIDMGITTWEYPEGRVYFNTEGVFKVEPYR